METSRYYYEAPARAFLWAESDGVGFYRITLLCPESGCSGRAATSIIANSDTLIIETDEPIRCEGYDAPQCRLTEITKEIEENGQP